MLALFGAIRDDTTPIIGEGFDRVSAQRGDLQLSYGELVKELPRELSVSGAVEFRGEFTDAERVIVGLDGIHITCRDGRYIAISGSDLAIRRSSSVIYSLFPGDSTVTLMYAMYGVGTTSNGARSGPFRTFLLLSLCGADTKPERVCHWVVSVLDSADASVAHGSRSYADRKKFTYTGVGEHLVWPRRRAKMGGETGYLRWGRWQRWP